MTPSKGIRRTKKHLPASHPVLQRKLARIEELGLHKSWISDRIEELARLVQRLPDENLTVQQRQDMKVIASELLRRASATASSRSDRSTGGGPAPDRAA